MDSSRRDFFRQGGQSLLRTLADLIGGRPTPPPAPPPSPDQAGHALRNMRLKRAHPPAPPAIITPTPAASESAGQET